MAICRTVLRITSAKLKTRPDLKPNPNSNNHANIIPNPNYMVLCHINYKCVTAIAIARLGPVSPTVAMICPYQNFLMETLINYM